MVDQALLEQVLRLDEPTRRELRDATEDSLDDDITPSMTAPLAEIAAIIDRRIAKADADPDGFMPLGDFECEVRARRSA